MRTLSSSVALLVWIVIAAPSPVFAQEADDQAATDPAAAREDTTTLTEDRAARDAANRRNAGTTDWCDDATTLCWTDDPDRQRKIFAGLRFVFEPQLGVIVQTGDEKFVDTNFKALEKVGVATNLYGSPGLPGALHLSVHR